MNDLKTVLDYHERTKHHFHRYARSPSSLDWANEPNPYRGYRGAERIQLELNRQLRPLSYHCLYEPQARPPVPLDAGSLADFFRYSLALSAWKQSGASRWALRVNPSSGALHPTEAYILAGSLDPHESQPALYHYVSETHALERRAVFPRKVWQSLTRGLPDGAFLVGLSSILWREVWKYGERGFRYCQHDVGHALAALRFAAGLCGWNLRLVSNWSCEDVAALLGLNRSEEFISEEAEEPELLAVVAPNSADLRVASLPSPDETLLRGIRAATWFGRANRLSREHVHWPLIDEAARATRIPRDFVPHTAPAASAGASTQFRLEPDADARQIVYQRRSCLALDGNSTVARKVFLGLLSRTLPGPHAPWDALDWPPMIDLALFVHRVKGLAPGLYLLVRDPQRIKGLKAAMRSRFEWKRPRGVPREFPLFLLLEGDCRDIARALACHQEIASDGFFSLAMIAEFAKPLDQYGPWFYRNLHWEAGLIGQVLYLEAEAAGARSTGIGCFFDDPTHEVLGLTGHSCQNLYQFAVGVPVEDSRLKSWEPYTGTAGEI